MTITFFYLKKKKKLSKGVIECFCVCSIAFYKDSCGRFTARSHRNTVHVPVQFLHVLLHCNFAAYSLAFPEPCSIVNQPSVWRKQQSCRYCVSSWDFFFSAQLAGWTKKKNLTDLCIHISEVDAGITLLHYCILSFTIFFWQGGTLPSPRQNAQISSAAIGYLSL